MTPTFAVAAEKFIAVVDAADEQTLAAFLRDLEPALVALYAAGLALEDLGLDDESDPPEAMTTDEAAALQRHLGQKLGKNDVYLLIYERYDLDSSPVVGSLADDIADIYRDLQDGFAELRGGKPANANWRWKFGFDSHWGHHASEAICALYTIRSRPFG
jgi:hypothetical protein